MNSDNGTAWSCAYEWFLGAVFDRPEHTQTVSLNHRWSSNLVRFKSSFGHYTYVSFRIEQFFWFARERSTRHYIRYLKTLLINFFYIVHKRSVHGRFGSIYIRFFYWSAYTHKRNTTLCANINLLFIFRISLIWYAYWSRKCRMVVIKMSKILAVYEKRSLNVVKRTI